MALDFGSVLAKKREKPQEWSNERKNLFVMAFRPHAVFEMDFDIN